MGSARLTPAQERLIRETRGKSEGYRAIAAAVELSRDTALLLQAAWAEWDSKAADGAREDGNLC